jgi:hypothetical protein
LLCCLRKEKEKGKEKEKRKEKGKEPTLKDIGLKHGRFVSKSVRIDTIINFVNVAINPKLKFFSPSLSSLSPCDLLSLFALFYK